MAHLLLLIVIAIAVVIILFVVLDYFAGAANAVDRRLWLLLKGLIVLGALVIVLEKAGVVV